MATSDKIQKDEPTIDQLMDLSRLLMGAYSKLSGSQIQGILGNKKTETAFLRAIAKKHGVKLSTQTEAVMLQLRGIVDFYKKVCDTDVSSILEYEEIFLGEDARILGLVVKSVGIADMADAFRGQKEWEINFSHYGDLSRIKDHQVRPDKDLQLFAYKGGAEPDQEFLNTSFNQFMKMDKLFASALEYMAMQGIARHTTGEWLDHKGWTRTSSTWPDGYFVSGHFHPDDSKPRLGCGRVDHRDPDDGPRQIFLL